MSDVEVRVQGAQQLERVARALKEAGDKKLRSELNKALKQAAEPITAASRARALVTLPRHGGLAARAAGAPQKVSVRASGKQAGVRIGVAGRGIAGSDRGVVRHPVFGNRSVFVNQTVRGGWFSKTAEASGPEVRTALVQALEDVAGRVR